MIELKSADQLSRAIAKAKASKLLVQVTNASRQYRVTNHENGNTYTVDFFVRNGKRFGHCGCKGGARNLACKHLAAAAALNIWRAATGLNNQVTTSH
jgi:uncharacterized Zn finger protein